MQHQKKSACFPLFWTHITALAIAIWLLWPAHSDATDSSTIFPDVADLPIRTNMPNPMVTAGGKTITTPEHFLVVILKGRQTVYSFLEKDKPDEFT